MADKRTNEELHRALWRWLAETGEEYKSKWPGWKSQDFVWHKCFACESCQCECENCPILWGEPPKPESEYQCERNPDSPYYKWDMEEDPEERKRLAAIIAELPWKDGGWK